MIIEIREYVTIPGKREEWVDFMRETVVPYQESHGITVVGQYLSRDDPDRFVWIRRFADEEEYERLTAAVYGTSIWADEIAPRVGRLLVAGQSRVTFLEPVDDARAGLESALGGRP